MIASLIIEADDWLIEQPCPSMATEATSVTLEGELDRDLVATQGVHPLGLGIGCVEVPLVAGVAIVVEDDLPVEVFEAHEPTPKSSPAFRKPPTRASMSSSVL